MKKNLMIVATLGGVFLLARKQGGSQTGWLPLLTRREHEDRLANLLEHALSYRNRGMWDEVSEECRKAGRPDLPGLIRKKFPEWAEQLDKA